MLHRNKKDKDLHLGKWNGLGGKMEQGESPEECAKREIQEESGLHLTKINFAGHLTFPNFDGENDWSVFIFKGLEFHGEQIESSPEGELHWISQEKILTLNLWEGDKHFLPYVFNDQIFTGKIVYENGHLIDCQLATL